MPNHNTKDIAPLEPALVNERGGAHFLSVSPRAFRVLVDAGEIRKIKIPGLKRIAYDVEELRGVVKRWKG
jgi:hypothetical protein